MRISDWSSDVCSSDLCAAGEGGAKRRVRARLFEVSGQKKTRLAAGVLQVAGSPTRALGDDELLAPTLRVGWRDKATPALRRALDPRLRGDDASAKPRQSAGRCVTLICPTCRSLAFGPRGCTALPPFCP